MKRLILLLSAAFALAFSSMAQDPVRGFMAHRGVHLKSTLAGENSIEAIDYAVRAGFYCIETDCRYTSDSVLVIMHDGNLNRTCVNADGSPIKGDVKVSELTLDQLRRDFRLKASREEYRTQVPTLKEYLEHCRQAGLPVFIEPKLNDPSGKYYLDIISVADEALGRDGYVITSNNYANEIIRNVLGIKDVRLMGLLYQTTYEKMASLGNVIFAISTTGFSEDDYFLNMEKAVKDGCTIQSAGGLISQKPDVRYATFELLNRAPKMNYIATDLLAPDYHGQGECILDLHGCRKLAKALSEAGRIEFGGIYVDFEYSGHGVMQIDADTVILPDKGKGKNTVRYQRMFFDSVPTVSFSNDGSLRLRKMNVKVVRF